MSEWHLGAHVPLAEPRNLANLDNQVLTGSPAPMPAAFPLRPAWPVLPVGVALPMPDLWAPPRALRWRVFPGPATTSAHSPLTQGCWQGPRSRRHPPGTLPQSPALPGLSDPVPLDNKTGSQIEATSPCTLPPSCRASLASLPPVPGLPSQWPSVRSPATM